MPHRTLHNIRVAKQNSKSDIWEYVMAMNCVLCPRCSAFIFRSKLSPPPLSLSPVSSHQIKSHLTPKICWTHRFTAIHFYRHSRHSDNIHLFAKGNSSRTFAAYRIRRIGAFSLRRTRVKARKCSDIRHLINIHHTTNNHKNHENVRRTFYTICPFIFARSQCGEK